MCGLRPLTIAEMQPGEPYIPGYMLFTMQTLPVAASGGSQAAWYSVQVWLPEQFREPTVENLKAVMSYLRENDPDAREVINKVAAIARSPQSRERARELGMSERPYSVAEADHALAGIRVL